MLDLVRTIVCLCVAARERHRSCSMHPPPNPQLRLFSFFFHSLSPSHSTVVADGTATHTAWARRVVQLQLKEKTEDSEAERKGGLVYALVAGLKAPPPTLPPLKISVATASRTTNTPRILLPTPSQCCFDYSGINLHLPSSLSGHWAFISWRQCDPCKVK